MTVQGPEGTASFATQLDVLLFVLMSRSCPTASKSPLVEKPVPVVKLADESAMIPASHPSVPPVHDASESRCKLTAMSLRMSAGRVKAKSAARSKPMHSEPLADPPAITRPVAPAVQEPPLPL